MNLGTTGALLVGAIIAILTGLLGYCFLTGSCGPRESPPAPETVETPQTPAPPAPSEDPAEIAKGQWANREGLPWDQGGAFEFREWCSEVPFLGQYGALQMQTREEQLRVRKCQALQQDKARYEAARERQVADEAAFRSTYTTCPAGFPTNLNGLCYGSCPTGWNASTDVVGQCYMSGSASAAGSGYVTQARPFRLATAQ